MSLSHILPHGIFLLLLLLAALWLPLPLYLTALALFGLPHVIWEMAFLRSRYAGRWSLNWWIALWLVLLIQAGMRTGLWLGSVSGCCLLFSSAAAISGVAPDSQSGSEFKTGSQISESHSNTASHLPSAMPTTRKNICCRRVLILPVSRLSAWARKSPLFPGITARPGRRIAGWKSS